MKGNWIVVVLLIIITILMAFYIYNADFSPKDNNDELLKKINQLELKIDSLNGKKDSIRSVIDSTHVKIVTNEKHYQERITTILSEPDSFSESFTRQYLRDYAATRGYRIIGASETE